MKQTTIKKNDGTKAGLREKISYGLCGMTYELEVMFVTSYLTLFCTDVMLIDAAKVGLLFLLAKILDAITDIIVTNLADKTETKLGKYRPWLLSGILLSIFVILNFWYPQFLNTQNNKMIWVCVIYICTVPILETCYMCPYLVLGSVMSADPDDRMQFQVAKTVGENVSDFLISFFAMTIILMFGDYRNLTGWRVAGAVFGVLMLITTIVGFSGTKERVKVSNKSNTGEKLTFAQKLKFLKGNHAYFKLLAAQFGFMVPWFATIVMFAYFCINVLGHEEWVAVLSTIGIVVQLIVTVFMPKLAKKIEKRTLMIWGGVLVIVAGIILVFTRGFAGALIYQIIRGIGIGLVYISVFTFWTDMTDYVEYKAQSAAPGIVYAIESFCTKIFGALATYFSSLILTFGKYDAELPIQSDGTLAWLRFGMVGIMVIGGIIITVCSLALTELSEKNLQMYRSVLNERRVAVNK